LRPFLRENRTGETATGKNFAGQFSPSTISPVRFSDVGANQSNSGESKILLLRRPFDRHLGQVAPQR